MEEDSVKEVAPTSDASTVYREQTGLDVARVDSAAQCGNLAEITKNTTFTVNANVVGAPLIRHVHIQRSSSVVRIS